MAGLANKHVEKLAQRLNGQHYGMLGKSIENCPRCDLMRKAIHTFRINEDRGIERNFQCSSS